MADKLPLEAEADRWFAFSRIELEPLFASNIKSYGSVEGQKKNNELWRSLAVQYNEKYPDLFPQSTHLLIKRWGKLTDKYKKRTALLATHRGKIPAGDKTTSPYFRMFDTYFRNTAHPDYRKMMEQEPDMLCQTDEDYCRTVEETRAASLELDEPTPYPVMPTRTRENVPGRKQKKGRRCIRCIVPPCPNTSANTDPSLVKFVAVARKRYKAKRKKLLAAIGIPDDKRGGDYFICTAHYPPDAVDLTQRMPVRFGVLPDRKLTAADFPVQTSLSTKSHRRVDEDIPNYLTRRLVRCLVPSCRTNSRNVDWAVKRLYPLPENEATQEQFYDKSGLSLMIPEAERRSRPFICTDHFTTEQDFRVIGSPVAARLLPTLFLWSPKPVDSSELTPKRKIVKWRESRPMASDSLGGGPAMKSRSKATSKAVSVRKSFADETVASDIRLLELMTVHNPFKAESHFKEFGSVPMWDRIVEEYNRDRMNERPLSCKQMRRTFRQLFEMADLGMIRKAKRYCTATNVQMLRIEELLPPLAEESRQLKTLREEQLNSRPVPARPRDDGTGKETLATKCVVVNCDNWRYWKTGKQTHRPLFCVPQPDDRRAVWAEKLGLTSLSKKGMVCFEHFEEKHFGPTGKLKKSAIPTLNLRGENSTGKTAEDSNGFPCHTGNAALVRSRMAYHKNRQKACLDGAEPIQPYRDHPVLPATLPSPRGRPCFIKACPSATGYRYLLDIGMFKFLKAPADDEDEDEEAHEVYKKWVDAARLEDSAGHINEHRLICSIHFDQSVIDRRGQKVQLKPGAIPTRFLRAADFPLPTRPTEVVSAEKGLPTLSVDAVPLVMSDEISAGNSEAAEPDNNLSPGSLPSTKLVQRRTVRSQTLPNAETESSSSESEYESTAYMSDRSSSPDFTTKPRVPLRSRVPPARKGRVWLLPGEVQSQMEGNGMEDDDEPKPNKRSVKRKVAPSEGFSGSRKKGKILVKDHSVGISDAQTRTGRPRRSCTIRVAATYGKTGGPARSRRSVSPEITEPPVRATGALANGLPAMDNDTGVFQATKSNGDRLFENTNVVNEVRVAHLAGTNNVFDCSSHLGSCDALLEFVPKAEPISSSEFIAVWEECPCRSTDADVLSDAGTGMEVEYASTKTVPG